jgi:hypothetical protein
MLVRDLIGMELCACQHAAVALPNPESSPGENSEVIIISVVVTVGVSCVSTGCVFRVGRHDSEM